MDFLAILVCLIIERFTVAGKKTREFHLTEQYLYFIKPFFKKIAVNEYIQLFLILAPAAVGTGFVFWILSFFYYGIFGFIFAVVVLFYCLGTFDVSHESGTGHALKMANQNIFVILFWFMAFAKWGLMAAVVYRTIDFTVKHVEDDRLISLAQKIQQYLDWIPVRLFTLGISFVSHFLAIIPYWMKHVLSGISSNDLMLEDCGSLAIESDISDMEHANKIRLLVDRVLIFWLVIIALIVMI